MEKSPQWKASEELAMRRIIATDGRNLPDDIKGFVCLVDSKYKQAIWNAQLKKYLDKKNQKEFDFDSIQES
mgnify:CR=1 FL=1